MCKIWRLGVLLIVLKDDKILLVRKTVSQEWQLPAGGREGNECVLDTAGRELREETGIDISDALSVDVSFVVRQFEWSNEWKLKRGTDGQQQHIVIVKVPSNTVVVVDNFELDYFNWVTLDNAMNILTHKDMRETLKKVLEGFKCN